MELHWECWNHTKALIQTITPFAFGSLYNFSNKTLGVPSLIFYLSILLLVSAFFIVVFPFKTLINSIKYENIVFSLETKKQIQTEYLLETSDTDGKQSQMTGYQSL